MKSIFFSILILLPLIGFSQEYKILQTNEYGSCADYEIYQKIDLPDTIIKALECPPWVDIQGEYLTILSQNNIFMYDFKTKQTTTLFTIFDDIDGISAPAWSPDKNKMMFVIINQQQTHNYKSFARIIVLTIDNGKVISKEKFDKPVNFICGSVCTSISGQDFYFIDNKTIEYKININIENNSQKKEKIMLKN